MGPNGNIGYIMELSSSGPLDSRRMCKLWKEDDAHAGIKRTEFILQLISGLWYIHEHATSGFVHGDLKPSNILCFGPQPVPKISDFGITKV